MIAVLLTLKCVHFNIRITVHDKDERGTLDQAVQPPPQKKKRFAGPYFA